MPSLRAHANTVLIRIGTEIRRRRQKLGISQRALATKAGVHFNVVGRTERGKYNPSVLTLDAIAAALDTSRSICCAGRSSRHQNRRPLRRQAAWIGEGESAAYLCRDSAPQSVALT